MKAASAKTLLACPFLVFILSCTNNDNSKIVSAASSLDLKRGDVVSCGPQDGEIYGSVSFAATVPDDLKKDFNIGVALLHSFEYDEAEKMFAKVIDKDPACAMAYWGVAMSNFHTLWTPPTSQELEKGSKAIQIAMSIEKKTKRESDYIEAMGKFYENAGQLDHRSRVLNFEKAMEKIYLEYKDDDEAAIFYCLALDAAADPTDKTYAKQRKAFSILEPLFKKDPLHPGVAHYIIHSCDYPSIAELALPAARKYAAIAPASAHAQHMPSHIFTRLGLWDECIQSNIVSVASAKCYGEKLKLKGHWDEELHGIDYLIYSYLQKGDDVSAKQQLDYLLSINEVSPVTFKTAYAFAASPSRYFLEKKMWKEAADLKIHPVNYPWDKFPWQEAIIHFTRVMGSVNINDVAKAKTELESLRSLHAKLQSLKDKAKEAAQVAVQVKTSEAWIEFRSGDKNKALQLMTAAADMEDAMEKHPVTPGEVIPARELLGEMLLQMDQPALALKAFEKDLQSHVNRFNALRDAGIAADKAGMKEKSKEYFKKLKEIAAANTTRKLS